MSDRPDGIVHIKIAKELYFINHNTVKCQNKLHQLKVLLIRTLANETIYTSHKTKRTLAYLRLPSVPGRGKGNSISIP